MRTGEEIIRGRAPAILIKWRQRYPTSITSPTVQQRGTRYTGTLQRLLVSTAKAFRHRGSGGLTRRLKMVDLFLKAVTQFTEGTLQSVTSLHERLRLGGNFLRHLVQRFELQEQFDLTVLRLAECLVQMLQFALHGHQVPRTSRGIGEPNFDVITAVAQGAGFVGGFVESIAGRLAIGFESPRTRRQRAELVFDLM